MQPLITTPMVWDEDVLHQDFFESTYATLCEKDRSSLLQLNRISQTAFLKFEKIRLSTLNLVASFFKKETGSFPVQIQDNLSKAVQEADSLLKIDDRYFAIAKSISELVNGLNAKQKKSLKDCLSHDIHQLRLVECLRLDLHRQKAAVVELFYEIQFVLKVVNCIEKVAELTQFVANNRKRLDDPTDDYIAFDFIELSMHVLEDLPTLQPLLNQLKGFHTIQHVRALRSDCN